MATLAFLEITTAACNMPAAAWRRDSVTEGPAKRDCVNNAADVQGRLDVTTTKSSVSSLIPILATCAVKPVGSERESTMQQSARSERSVSYVARSRHRSDRGQNCVTVAADVPFGAS